MQETKYTVSGRYFQFLRTILPLGTSLTTLGKTLPTRTLVISALKSSLKGLFTGYIKTLIIKYPAQLANWYQRTKKASELKAAEVERGTVQTSKNDSPKTGSTAQNLTNAKGLKCSEIFVP